MIRLYGLRMSNYYSLIKALMIEKSVAFEEISAPPFAGTDFQFEARGASKHRWGRGGKGAAAKLTARVKVSYPLGQRVRVSLPACPA